MIEFAAYDEYGAVTAGPIEGVTWSGIMPDHRFWPLIMQWVEDGHEITAYSPPPPEAISKRQFFQQMAIEGNITQAEALAAVAPGNIPAEMDALIAQLPEEQRFAVRMLVSGASDFLRQHPVTLLIGHIYGYSSSDIDRVWREASLL